MKAKEVWQRLLTAGSSSLVTSLCYRRGSITIDLLVPAQGGPLLIQGIHNTIPYGKIA